MRRSEWCWFHEERTLINRDEKKADSTMEKSAHNPNANLPSAMIERDLIMQVDPHATDSRCFRCVKQWLTIVTPLSSWSSALVSRWIVIWPVRVTAAIPAPYELACHATGTTMTRRSEWCWSHAQAIPINRYEKKHKSIREEEIREVIANSPGAKSNRDINMSLSMQ